MLRNKLRLGLLAMLATALMGCQLDPGPEDRTDIQSSASISASAECHVGAPGDETYCTETCPCTIGEGDCDSSNQCEDGLRCSFNVGADFGYAPTVDVCTCPDASDLGDSSFCSALCPCSEGQGDCDEDTECGTGLTCYSNVGAFYDLEADDDVCATCLPQEAVHTIDFCTPDCQCSEGQGDCDSDADCEAGLDCFLNVGVDFGLPADADVCAACPPPSRAGGTSFCSAECPCDEGGGDCDNDNECAAGLTCFSNVGVDFDMDPDTDVCAECPPPSKRGSSSFCSAECPCAEGGGDCDNNNQCQAGLVCGDDLGPQYGLGASIDVCVPPPN